MRHEFINLFAELNAKELAALTEEVKETIAYNTPKHEVKDTFTAANLWNIHNMRRVRQPRRAY